MATHIFISLDVLNTILKEEILEWTVTETASVQDKHFTYTLSDSEQKMREYPKVCVNLQTDVR